MDWIKKGLRFSCRQCGNCCTGSPGYIWVTLAEIGALAGHLKMDLDAFSLGHVKRVGERFSLLEKPGGECVFWDRKRGCTVYPVRPAQCRAYPFWPRVVASEKSWKAEAAECHGIRAALEDGDGEMHSAAEIRDTATRSNRGSS